MRHVHACDHSAPPLAILPLVAREMRAWLDSSPDRVAVLHCKGPFPCFQIDPMPIAHHIPAGKGRSGTMACSYLLSLDVTPSAPTLERSLPFKEWARRRANEWMEVMPPDADSDRREAIDAEKEVGGGSVKALDTQPPAIADDVAPPDAALGQVSEVSTASSASGTDTPKTKPSPLLQEVLDLHTSGRMRAAKDANKKVKPGVSIPSQRRVSSFLVHIRKSTDI